MHFWIDKRSQACGFGRALVAASLGGGGVGLGFGGPPRRMISKPSAASIHRLQSNHDTQRPHSNNSNSNNSHTQNTNGSNNSNNNNTNRNNRNRSNNSGSTSSSPYQQRHPHENNHHSRHHNQPQYRQQNNSLDHHVSHSLPRASAQLLTVNNQDCHIPVALPHSYGGPSHVHDLEQGSLGIETYPIRAGTMTMNSIGPTVPTDGHIALVDASTEAQLLPPHLKFGMCASLVLASVFIAGAKYYFDHQGGSMDVLIFCAFLAISFLALCTISLCRYVPRDLTASPSISVDGHSRMIDGQLHHSVNRELSGGGGSLGLANGSPHPQIYGQGGDQNGHDLSHSPITNAITAPPPPYHIAILLPPENGKELQPDESPPPSYDKILI